MLNKIANRFLIGYSVPLAFLIVQGLTIAFMSQKVFDLQNVISHLQATRQEFEQTSYEISRMLRSARGYALFPKDQSFKTIFNATYESFNQHAQALRESTTIPQHEDITNTLITPENTLIAEGNKLHDIFQEAFNLSVVTTITKVADQTNLLSLNAAIEAEKAGEYGAGFAVVAREIRRLADQTAVATLEIEQMVLEMQSSVSTGVMEMDKFNLVVSNSVDQVGRISGQIAQVIEQVQSLTPRFESVSHSMDQQFEGAQQISVAIAQLSEASQQTLESLQETNRAVEQLDDTAQGLQGVVSQFKVQN